MQRTCCLKLNISGAYAALIIHEIAVGAYKVSVYIPLYAPCILIMNLNLNFEHKRLEFSQKCGTYCNTFMSNEIFLKSNIVFINLRSGIVVQRKI